MMKETEIILPNEQDNPVKTTFDLLIENDLDIERAATVLLQSYKKQLQERKIIRNKKKRGNKDVKSNKS